MSKIALQGDASGTGTLTIAAPNTNTDATITLPVAGGTLVTTGGTQPVEFTAGTVSAPSITFTGDTNTGIYSPAADTIAFTKGGTEALRITSTGAIAVNGASSYGTSGQVLTSQGNAAPTWTTISSGGATGISGQVFAANGTFTIPTGVTALKVTVVGAGGSGTKTSDYGGGGGGAGGSAIKYLTGLTPGNTLAVTIGTGGAARTTNSAGAAGGNSSVASGTQTITTIQGNGGSGGGLSGTASPGGAGGSASGGDINITGAGGADNAYVIGQSCGIYRFAGIGGPSIFPSYGPVGITAPGNSGTGSGGTGTLSFTSGAGGNGIVIFEW